MSALNFIDRYGINSVITVSSSYTSGGTSLVVSSATGLPTGACNFYLLIEAESSNTEEVLECTNVSGTTLTVAGAKAGTSASNHSVGAKILASIMTKDAFAQLEADWILAAGTRAGVLWSGSANPGQPSITTVQSLKSGESVGSFAYGVNVTAGNLLVCVAGVANGNLFFGGVFNDSQSNVWTNAVQAAPSGGNNGVAIGYAVAGSSAACTVTVTCPPGSFSGGGASQICLFEFASSNLTHTVDSTGTNYGGPIASVLTSQAYDFLISAAYYTGNAAATVSGTEALLENDLFSDRSTAVSSLLATSIGTVTSSLNAGTGAVAYVTAAFKTTPVTSFGITGDWYLNTTTGELWTLGSSGWSTSGYKWTVG